MTSKKLKLGFIGCCRAFELAQLFSRQSRSQPYAIYSPRVKSAEEFAKDAKILPAYSFTKLIKASDGLIITELDWLEAAPITCSIEFERPCLILANAYQNFSHSRFLELQKQAEFSSGLLMPELPYRWGRSTLRFRELIATKVQKVDHLSVFCACEFDSHSEFMVYDWCLNVIQSECRNVIYDPSEKKVTLEFRRLNQEGAPVKAEIIFQSGETSEHVDFAITSANAHCQNGVVQISGESEIHWACNNQKDVSESLVQDRTSEEVMVDLFGRRLVGGLVPVPDLADLIRASSIREQRRQLAAH